MSKDYNPEELAQYLDKLLQSATTPAPDGVADPMVEVALQLAHAKPPQLGADARTRMLEKVQHAHQSALKSSATKPNQTVQFPMQSILRWVAVFAVFVVIMSSMAIPAMADSLPGDILYPVKLTLESVELGLATSDNSRAEVYIRQAERRLDEANQLLDLNTVNVQLVTNAMDNLEQAILLQPENPIILLQVKTTATDIENRLNQVAEVDSVSANHLSQRLSTLSPTLDPTLVAEARQPMIPATITITPSLTSTPTLTDTPLPSATFTPTLTNTPLPSATFTPTLTNTPLPSATFTSQPTATIVPPDELTHTATLESSPTSTDEPTQTPIYESYIGVVSATTLVNIRTLPTIDSKIIDQVTPGTIVTVIGESIDGQWLEIDTDHIQQGWVSSSLIVKGTIPLFTLSPAAELGLTALPPASSTILSDSVDTTDDNSASNQGNDGINKFGCDGQGNSCNANGNGNGNKDKKKKNK